MAWLMPQAMLRSFATPHTRTRLPSNSLPEDAIVGSLVGWRSNLSGEVRAAEPATATDDRAALRTGRRSADLARLVKPDRKSTRLNSSHVKISYSVFCLKKNTNLNSKCIFIEKMYEV